MGLVTQTTAPMCFPAWTKQKLVQIINLPPSVGCLNRLHPQGPSRGWQQQPVLLSRQRAPRRCPAAEDDGRDMVIAASSGAKQTETRWEAQGAGCRSDDEGEGRTAHPWPQSAAGVREALGAALWSE